MSTPLVTRPAYGYGGDIVAEARLPEGDPAGRGVSLSPDVPGTSTYAKPSDSPLREQGKSDESMYHVEDADDLTKEQSRPDSIDHSKDKPSISTPGPEDGNGKTKYPYRDGVPNTHNARVVLRVAHNWLADIALEIPIDLGQRVKLAARLEEIETGLGKQVLERSKTCSVTTKRVDVGNLRWLFSVDCGNGEKTVKMKASRKGKVTALSKMSVTFTCSCHAWRWLGSEYHAKKEKYIDGKPRGTASVPVIKDPEGVNRVCKHVAAVFGTVRNWTIPVK